MKPGWVTDRPVFQILQKLFQLERKLDKQGHAAATFWPKISPFFFFFNRTKEFGSELEKRLIVSILFTLLKIPINYLEFNYIKQLPKMREREREREWSLMQSLDIVLMNKSYWTIELKVSENLSIQPTVKNCDRFFHWHISDVQSLC